MAPEQRRALRILADAVQHGITIPVLMMVHGFPADLLAGLMLDGARHEVIRAPQRR
jgi:hypothetical protein